MTDNITMGKQRISVGIVYPADPVGTIPGGIDTFVRGILKSAPTDIEMGLIGVTTDPVARPVGRWTECQLGTRTFSFYPVLALSDPGKRPLFPLSLRFTAALFARDVGRNFDVLEFHRIEPSLRYLFDKTPKNLVLHQSMENILNRGSDIRWKWAPSLFFKLEDWLMPKMNSIHIVREAAANEYKKRYPSIADRVHFLPTWVDPEVFHPLPEPQSIVLRASVLRKYGIRDDDFVLIFVGRLDHSKDPLLLLESFALALKQIPRARLIMVGDGVLRDQVRSRIASLQLEERTILAGLRSAREVADLLRVSQMFVLTSAYEGMPMCVLEALGSGVPVVTTDVGEVRRVVKPGINGEIATQRSAETLSAAICSGYQQYKRYRGTPCTDAVADFVPSKVLAPFFENYRRLAGSKHAKPV